MWRPSAEVYVSGWAQLVEDLDTKTRLWRRTDLPFDPVGFFGAAENPDFVLVRMVPERGVLFDHSGRSLWSRETYRLPPLAPDHAEDFGGLERVDVLVEAGDLAVAAGVDPAVVVLVGEALDGRRCSAAAAPRQCRPRR